MTRVGVARWGEAQAAAYLRRLGWELVERNWHCRYGEIDLVARDGEVLVFVEVKTRRNADFGRPEDALTAAKRRRLTRSAWTFLEQRGLQAAPWRFDVVAIEGRPGRAPERLDHYADAFEADPQAAG